MISKSKKVKSSGKLKEITLNDFYKIFVQESILLESEKEKREREVLLDKLEIYTKGKDLVLENSLI